MICRKFIKTLKFKSEQCLGWLPPTITRLSIGLLFVGTGWGKIHHLDQVTDYFVSLHIPFPALNAYVVGFTELICGGLLLLGLFTRLAAVPLMISMVVAVITAKADDVHSFNDLSDVTEYLYILLLLWLAFRGPGPISMDNVIEKQFLDNPS